MRTKSILLFSLLLISICSIAQKPDTSEPLLTNENITAFIEKHDSIMLDFKAISFKHIPENYLGSASVSTQNIEELNRIVQKYSYNDFESYSQLTWVISACYGKIKIDTEAMPEIEKTLNEIEADENMTEEQKQAAKNQIEQALEGIQNAFKGSTNKKDLETIKPFMTELTSLFENNKH